MRALLFDPFSGISGDMTIAALLDLGLSEEWLRGFVADLGLGRIDIGIERVERRGIACTRLVLDLPEEHAHRHLRDIVEVIDAAGVDAEVRERAVEVFTLLAEAEARVHGTTPDKIHFHEVGALDAIVDVLGSVGGCLELGFRDFYTRPAALGRGWIDIAHGRYPVPPPAVVELLRGVPVSDPPFQGECTTPTGAALLQGLTRGKAPPEPWTPVRTGFGAGTRDPADRPNCLRLVAIETAPTAEELFVVQTDVDDLSPEYVPPLLDALRDAGALDATAAPLLMKKGRPGLRIEALAGSAVREAVVKVLFRDSSTLGIRWWPVARTALPRSEEVVEWRGQQIRVKRGHRPDGDHRAKPEFEDVVRAARELGSSPFAVYRGMIGDGVVSGS